MKTTKRYLNEMFEMYGLPTELYTMKRGVYEDKYNRFDITTIPPLVINGQYNKTKGHIHSTGHDELYIVDKGEAIFILQSKKEFKKIYAKAGDMVYIRGKYYHATINPSKTQTLELSNWISRECISDYSYIEKKKGMKYYYTINGWVKNPNYK